MDDIKRDRFSHKSQWKSGGTDIRMGFQVLTLFLSLHLCPLVNQDFTFWSDRIPTQTGLTENKTQINQPIKGKCTESPKKVGDI